MCPKSYLYIYDFRHIYIRVLPNRSELIGTGSWINRFSVSSIRSDMFPNMSSGDALVSFPQDRFLLVAPYHSLPDTVRPLVVEGVSDQIEVPASDRQWLPLVPIHFIGR